MDADDELLQGQAHQQAGRLQEAADAYQRALSLDPGHEPSLYHLGQLAHRCGHHPQAIDLLRRAVEIRSDSAEAWYGLGCVHTALGEHAAAAACLRRAVALWPGWSEARHNLGSALMALGQADEALGQFAEAARGPDRAWPLAMIALNVPSAPGANNQDILNARRAWAELVTTLPKETAPGARRAGPLRVGYVSSFFHRDNWMKPVWGLLNRHDRRAFEVHLFSESPASAIRHGYVAHPDDRFHDLSGLSNVAAAERIRQAEIDLLVDLNGFSALPRLEIYAQRPAPVIAGWFNWYATTGMDCYDYLIGDAEVIPPEEERFYGETILRVPGSYLSFEVAYPVPEVAPAPADGGAVRFGCLAPLYKITPPVVAAWSEILRRAPGTTLLLKNTAFRSPDNREFVARAFGEHGIGAGRLRLEGPADHYQFLQTYGRIDVALDTFPYNGGTTTTEALWQGVPVVAFYGDRWAARTSASILRAAGLGQFVTANVEQYVALAVELATVPARRGELAQGRAGLRARLRASAVCDTAAFARNMETVYRQICSGKNG